MNKRQPSARKPRCSWTESDDLHEEQEAGMLAMLDGRSVSRREQWPSGVKERHGKVC